MYVHWQHFAGYTAMFLQCSEMLLGMRPEWTAGYNKPKFSSKSYLLTNFQSNINKLGY